MASKEGDGGYEPPTSPGTPMQTFDTSNGANAAYANQSIPTYAQAPQQQYSMNAGQQYATQGNPQQQQQQQNNSQYATQYERQALLARKNNGCLRCCKWCCAIFWGIAVLVLLSVFIAEEGIPYHMEYQKVEVVSPKAITGSFSNGFKYTIWKNQYKEGKVTAYLCVDTGSSNEADNQLGIAHFVEHCAFDSTRDHQGRNGLIWSLLSQGALFNAFTTWRTTCYQIWDMPNSTLAAETNTPLHYLENEVFGPEFLQPNLVLEKGAVEGEDRFRNSTAFMGLVRMLKNHGGGQWRIPLRFPIGKPKEMDYGSANSKAYHDKWYHPKRMRLMVVGDIADTAKLEKTIKTVYEGKSNDGYVDNVAIGTPKPAKTFTMEQIDGMDGVTFNLLATTDYNAPPFTYNDHRRRSNYLVFTLVHALSVLSHLSAEYPQLDQAELARHMSSAVVQPFYEMNTTLHLFATASPGAPQQSAWRRDFETGLVELRRLARHGPDRVLTGLLLTLLGTLPSTQLAYSGKMDSTLWAELLMGMDGPNYVFQDLEQQVKMSEQYLRPGFAGVTMRDVRAMAQHLWLSFVHYATGKYEIGPEGDPYTKLVNPVYSLNVYVGRDSSPDFLKTINENAIKSVIKKVLADDPPSAAGGLTLASLTSSSASATSGASSAASASMPADGQLVKLAAKKDKAPKASSTDAETGIVTYTLDNGIKVNHKPYASGKGKNPKDAYGKAYMEVVSLGGASTLPAKLKGACEVLNAGKFAGFSVYYSDSNYTDYTASTYAKALGSVPVSMSCSTDFTTITAPLGAQCVNFPELKNCTASYASAAPQVLQAVRLHMFPFFDQPKMWETARAYGDLEDQMKAVNEPLPQMEYYMLRKALGSYFNDHRFGLVTSSDLFSLNPLEVSRWVREQFQPVDRVVINVVGDVYSTDDLLKTLNQVFGSMPKLQQQRVGYSPYEDNDKGNFTITWPAADAYYNCSLKSADPNRGYVAVVAPAQDFRAHRADQWFTLENNLLNFAMFKTVRILHGYGYFAITRPVHNIMFPGTGAYVIIWAPGDYPAPRAGDPLNMQASSGAVHAAMRADIDQQVFDSIQPFVSKYMTGVYQGTEPWLVAMRGVGLKPPVTWPSDVTEVVSAGDINLPAKVASFKYDDVKGIFASQTGSKGMMSVFMDTIGYNQGEGRGNCFF